MKICRPGQNFAAAIAALSIASVLSAPAQAALSGSITIQGVVPAATAIVVVGITGFDNLDLSTTQADKEVANVTEINNTANGYKVTLTSQNAGALKNGTLGSVTYTAKYGSNSVTLSTTPQVITNAGPSSVVVNLQTKFKVSYTGAPASSMMQGTYSDTLTFTIAAN